MCGAQGIEFRAPLKTSPALQSVVAQLRQSVPTVVEDRYLAPSIESAAALIGEGSLTTNVDLPKFVRGRSE